jgi:hypothetical protein
VDPRETRRGDGGFDRGSGPGHGGQSTRASSFSDQICIRDLGTWLRGKGYDIPSTLYGCSAKNGQVCNRQHSNKYGNKDPLKILDMVGNVSALVVAKAATEVASALKDLARK